MAISSSIINSSNTHYSLMHLKLEQARCEGMGTSAVANIFMADNEKIKNYIICVFMCSWWYTTKQSHQFSWLVASYSVLLLLMLL